MINDERWTQIIHRSSLFVEQEVHHVAVLHDIIFSFRAQFARGAAAFFAFVVHKIVVAGDFGADEALFKISVDHTRRARRFPAFLNLPRAHFDFAGRQIRAKAQQVVAFVDQPVKAAFLHAVHFHVRAAFVRRDAHKLRFDFARDQNRARADFRGVVEDGFAVRVAVGGNVVLADVADEEDRLLRDQMTIGQMCELIGAEFLRANGNEFVEALERFFEHGYGGHRFLVGLAFGTAFQFRLDRLLVFEDQFHVDGFDVAHGIKFAIDVNHVRVLEAADDMQQRVHAFDRAEERIAFSLPGGRAAHEADDIDEFQLHRNHAVGFDDVFQDPQPLVRNGDDARIGIDGAERIVGRLRHLSHGQGVEDGAFANGGKTDETAVETHEHSKTLNASYSTRGIYSIRGRVFTRLSNYYRAQ